MEEEEMVNSDEKDVYVAKTLVEIVNCTQKFLEDYNKGEWLCCGFV